MPGIYGFVAKKQCASAHNRCLIEAMRLRLEHCPEYTSETDICDWCAIGNTALPVPGQQRFAVDQAVGRAATFSGYLYGWKDNGAVRPLTDCRGWSGVLMSSLIGPVAFRAVTRSGHRLSLLKNV